jgi:hypothetical protein
LLPMKAGILTQGAANVKYQLSTLCSSAMPPFALQALVSPTRVGAGSSFP